jgi:hypothetical protein
VDRRARAQHRQTCRPCAAVPLDQLRQSPGRGRRHVRGAQYRPGSRVTYRPRGARSPVRAQRRRTPARDPSRSSPTTCSRRCLRGPDARLSAAPARAPRPRGGPGSAAARLIRWRSKGLRCWTRGGFRLGYVSTRRTSIASPRCCGEG